jgi:hypothetical protein
MISLHAGGNKFIGLGYTLSHDFEADGMIHLLKPDTMTFTFSHFSSHQFHFVYMKQSQGTWFSGIHTRAGYRLGFVNGYFPFLHDLSLGAGYTGMVPVKIKYYYYFETGLSALIRFEAYSRVFQVTPFFGPSLSTGGYFPLGKTIHPEKNHYLGFGGFMTFAAGYYPVTSLNTGIIIFPMIIGFEFRYLFLKGNLR